MYLWKEAFSFGPRLDLVPYITFNACKILGFVVFSPIFVITFSAFVGGICFLLVVVVCLGIGMVGKLGADVTSVIMTSLSSSSTGVAS